MDPLTPHAADRAVTLRPDGLALAGCAAPLPLWSGALHYFRLSPGSWERALREVAALGLPLVESYVPWGVHEIAPGRFRFHAQYDLARFLDLCAEAGLRVLLRPGPHINAELPWFGFPERLARDAQLAMRSHADVPMLCPLPPRMFYAPSYAAERLYQETAGWYQALAEIVAPRLFPKGPVVGLQVDNELPFFFRTGAYDADYHPEALAAYTAWQQAEGLPEEPAPRRFLADPGALTDPAPLVPHLRWVAFKEALCLRALSRLCGLLDQAGLQGVLRFHNFPPMDPGPCDVPRAEALLDCAGLDMYHFRADYQRVRRRALYLAGSSRHPFVPELGAGSFPWGPALREEDSQATALCALAHGVRGFNIYMIADRDRWYGAPLGEDGSPRPERAGFYQRLLAGLREAGAPALQREAPVGVLIPREYQRLALCASHLGPLSPVFLEWAGFPAEMAHRGEALGLSGPVQALFPRRREALLQALQRLGRPFALLDASCSDDQLQRHRALLVPTYDFLDASLAARLGRFAAAGGALVLGPGRPTRDASLAPSAAVMEPLGGARFLPEPFTDAELAEALGPPEPEHRLEADDAARVDLSVHRDAAGQARLFALGNGHASPTTARLALPAAARLVDLVSGERFAGQAGLTVPLAPYGVRLLRQE